MRVHNVINRLAKLVLIGMIVVSATLSLPAFSRSGDTPSWINTSPPNMTRAYVYRQGFVLDESGNKMFAEYGYDPDPEVINDPENRNGKLIRVLEEFDASDPDLLLIGGSEYKATRDAIRTWKDSLPEGEWEKYRVVSAETYKSHGFASEYPEAWQAYLKVDPYYNSRSVLVYKPESLLEGMPINADDGIIVQQSKFQITKLIEDAGPAGKRSLIIDKQGEVKYQSDHNIGYRVAYFDPDNYTFEDGLERTSTNITRLEGQIEELLEENGIKDSLLGPIPGVELTGGGFAGTAGITDEFGFTVVSTIGQPCQFLDWGTDDEGNTQDSGELDSIFVKNIFAEVPYITFNPARATSLHKLYLAYPFDYPCLVLSALYPVHTSLIGVMTSVTLNDIAAGVAQPTIPRINIPVDVSIVTGTFNLYNGDEVVPIVKADDGTRKDVDPLSFDDYQEPQSEDLNNNGKPDHVSDNGSIPQPDGAPDDAAPLYGVWFSVPEDAVMDDKNVPYTEDGELIKPDLVRVATYEQSFDNVGLVKSISYTDLADTDIFVFRESTGQLVMEKKPFALEGDSHGDGLLWGNWLSGIAEEEAVGGPATITAFFETRIPGRSGRNSTTVGMYSRSTNDYRAWQSGARVTAQGVDTENKQSHIIADDFQAFSETLRKGEPLRIIVINRATGYIGSKRINVEDIEKSTNPDVPTPDLNDSTIGVNIGEIQLFPPNLKINVKRHYNVEYGATQGDEKIYRVGSEGSALATDQYVVITSEWLDEDGTPLPAELPGYTGRLTSLSSDETLKNSAEHFAIKPGLHTEIISLGDDSSKPTGAQYQYLHIVGEDETEVADFGASPNANNRPDMFVPFRVAVYDAKSTQLLKQALLEESIQENKAFKDPENSIYQWPHRPEMMYSIFDLDIAEILRTPEDEDGEAVEPIDITNNETPVLTASDKELSIVQDLIASEYDPLEYFGPESHLLYSLEGYQQQVNEGEGETYSFTDFGHLGELDSDDYLTLSLLNSQDAGNVLWEFAFETLSIVPPDDKVVLDLSADNAEGLVYSVFTNTSDEDSKPKERMVTWTAKGTTSIEKSSEKGADGYFTNTVDVETVAGTLFEIKAQLKDESSNVIGASYRVTPGVPRVLTPVFTGKAAIEKLGQITLTVLVQDRFGNTVDDGTPVAIYSPNLIIESDWSTTNGYVNAVIKGGEVPGAHELLISAGDIYHYETIHISDISLAIDGPSEVLVGEKLDVTITAESDYGILPDFNIEVSGFRAGLSNNYPIVSGNSASISADVGDFPGQGSVFAQIGENLYRHQFTVVDPSPVKVDARVIVSGVANDGSVFYDGNEIQYKTGTRVYLNGVAGESVDASLGDYLNPVIAPDLQYPLQRAHDDNGLVDSQLNLEGVVEGDVTLVDSHFNEYLKAYQFGSDGLLKIPYERLEDIDQLGIVLNINSGDETLLHTGDASSTRTIVSYAPSGFLLEWTSNNTLKFSVGTGNEVLSLESDSLSKNSWYQVGVHLVHGELFMQVDEDIYRSTTKLSAVPNQADSPLVIGEKFRGLISGLSVYDWANEPVITINGETESSYFYDASGEASFYVAVNPLATAQIEQRFIQYANVTSFGGGKVAYASSDCDSTTGPAFDPEAVDEYGDVLGSAMAMQSYLANCEFLPRMQKQLLIIRSESTGFVSTVKKSIAVVEFTAYTALYIQAMSSRFAIELGPTCAMNLVSAPSDLSSAKDFVCEIATSLFLVGDLRDYAWQSYWLFAQTVGSDGKLRYDRAVHIFASLGIASTVVPPLDASIGTLKVMAKVNKASPFPLAFASYLARKLQGNYSDPKKLVTVTRKMLPFMQFAAVAILLRDDFASAFNLIASLSSDDIDGFISYVEHAVKQVIPTELYAEADQLQRQRWMQVAWAAINIKFVLSKLDGGSTMQGLIKVLDDAFVILGDAKLRGGAGDRRNYMNSAISASIINLGTAIEKSVASGRSDEIGEVITQIIAKDNTLAALATAYDIGGGGDTGIALIKKLQATPARSSDFDLGGMSRQADLTAKQKLGAFLGFFPEISLMRNNGEITDAAYSSLSKVVSELGSNGSKQAINKAKGAAEVIALVPRLKKILSSRFPGKDIVITGFEVREPAVNGVGKVVSTRIYDLQFTVGTGSSAKVHSIEIKAWNPLDRATGSKTAITKYLKLSLNAKLIKKEIDGELVEAGEQLGQLRSDLIASINRVLDKKGNVDFDKLDNLWVFDGRAHAAGLTGESVAEELVEYLGENKDLRRKIFAEVAHTELSTSKKIEEFVKSNGTLQKLLTKMIVIEGSP